MEERIADPHAESEVSGRVSEKGFLSSLFSVTERFRPSEILGRIGAEELMLIGIAAYLFFSKEGDRECAIMLLALIFIT